MTKKETVKKTTRIKPKKRRTKAQIEADKKKKLELQKKEEERKKAQEEIIKSICLHFGEDFSREAKEESSKKGKGRPRVITQSEVQKIKACFSVGMNVREMLYYCQLKKSSFYNYCTENPDFLETIEYLKKSTTLQAKFNIQKQIASGSVQDSWKWLEKKCPEEFGNKVGVDISGDLKIGNINIK